MWVKCKQKDELIEVLLIRLQVAKEAPDLLAKKVRMLQQELDKRDGVEMFPDLYDDVR